MWKFIDQDGNGFVELSSAEAQKIYGGTRGGDMDLDGDDDIGTYNGFRAGSGRGGPTGTVTITING